MKLNKIKSAIFKNKIWITISVLCLFFLSILISIYNTNQSLRETQNELLRQQLEELRIQNELKQEEVNKNNLEELKEQEENLKSKECYAKMLNIIYPYYGYADTAFKYCLESTTYKVNECSQKRKDRIAELEAKEQKAKIDCGVE